MEETVQKKTNNPLGTASVNSLIAKFAIPSIVAMLVMACYNLVDQIFIGNVIGELGNAATNIAYPLTNACVAIGLMFGIGGASAFNLKMGAGEKDKAPYFFGNAVTMLIICGLALLVITEVLLKPIMILFGSPMSVLPYAMDYTKVVALGFPFYAFSCGASHLLRADGRPNVPMYCNILGAVLNIGLDAWFIIGLGWGMKGAAWATIIGQIIASLLCAWFMLHTKTFKLELKHLVPKGKYAGKDATLGLAPCLNQMAMMIVTIVLNNQLKLYGGQSIYGEEIPIACSGIVNKVGSIFMGMVIGLSQGTQPIWSFNYGAKNFRRVKEAYYRSGIYAFIVSAVAFTLFQTIPDKILACFGKGSDLYFEFGSHYFRIYMLLVIVFFIQLLSANFFTSIGKPGKGVFLSLTRQVIYLIPLYLIFPIFWGVEGILYAQPCADVIAITTAIIMVAAEFNRPEFKNEKNVFISIFKKKSKKINN